MIITAIISKYYGSLKAYHYVYLEKQDLTYIRMRGLLLLYNSVSSSPGSEVARLFAKRSYKLRVPSEIVHTSSCAQKNRRAYLRHFFLSSPQV